MRLIDADALDKRIYNDIPIGFFGSVKRMAAIRTMVEEEPTVTPEPGWISVEDRLPETGKHVLASCEIKILGGKKKRYTCVAMYAAEKSIVCSESGDVDSDYDEETDEYYLPEGWWECIHNWDEYSSVAIEDFVTHWMPLPEGPKEGT